MPWVHDTGYPHGGKAFGVPHYVQLELRLAVG